MSKLQGRGRGKQEIFMGIDVHERTYRVSLFCDGEEILNKVYASEYKHLRRLLLRYGEFLIHGVYEAGAFGYGLYDRLRRDGVDIIVTPPSKIPKEPGDFVKTDKRDSRKLAQLLSSGLLKAVQVPEKSKREDRELVRTRDQFVSQRRRVFQQVQSKLRFHDLPLRLKGCIRKKDREVLLGLPELSEPLRFAFERLLALYDYYTGQMRLFWQKMIGLSQESRYNSSVNLLKTVPGIGMLTALSWLLELPDMKHFEGNEKLAGFLGLTATEYSSGAYQRQGRITRCGNAKIRWLLVEASWCLVRMDGAIRLFYERIKRRRGGKRAIVAVARKLSGRLRTLLIKGEPYALGTV